MKLFSLSLVLLLTACSDNSMTKVYQQNLPADGISCLKLLVFPPNEFIEKSFHKFYQFDKQCKYTLQVEVKGGITCNSNENLQKKAMGSFPSSYINMQVSKNAQKIYSYYIDLKDEVDEGAIENALDKMREDLSL